MNIFIMVLVVLFMGAYYMLSSPGQRVINHETEYAVARSDMRAIAECTMAAHNAAIRESDFNDICTQQYNIKSEFICLNANLGISKCEIVRNRKPAFSYIITTTGPLDGSEYNQMLEILDEYYSDTVSFGIFLNNSIISGGNKSKQTVPAAIISSLKLSDGQLVYMTQYDIPDTPTEYSAPDSADIICPAGAIKTYRFGRWQCIGYNTKHDCGGDTIWDSDLMECVADESRKPLCAAQQTAVMVDNVWECINPFPEKSCPDNMIARLNYATLEWECVADPTNTPDTKKCPVISGMATSGGLGATLSIQTTSCTDCERIITDPDTCISVCVPDPGRIHDEKCYPGGANSCDGAIYFGFPNYSYIANVGDVVGKTVPLDRAHSQNRRFNCLKCDRGIDESRSFPPYIAVCK